MKTFIGKVVGKKMAKTAVVEVKTSRTHPLYHKKLFKVRKYHVHDELDAKVDDQVRFVPSRPYSKTKKWRLIEILKGKNS